MQQQDVPKTNHVIPAPFIEAFYPESRFGGFTDIDGTIAFFARVNALIKADDVVLEVGCGRGAHQEDPIEIRKQLRIFKGRVRRVIGIDVDPGASENPYLDEFKPITNSSWPIESNSIDCIVSDCVLEHVDEPNVFFSEARRVLRDGGYLCIRTTNVWSYVALASWLIPNRLHSRILRVVQDDRKEQDVFPVRYRCNSIRKINSALRKSGFVGLAYGTEAEPSYLSFSRLAFYLGVLHQRFAPRLIKPAIFAFGRLANRI